MLEEPRKRGRGEILQGRRVGTLEMKIKVEAGVVKIRETRKGNGEYS